jgi:hypothetical protein
VAGSVLFDVYGRFQVRAEQTDAGVWALDRLGSDGKRSRLRDVIIADHAPLAEVTRQLEAVYHELGSPGTSIAQVEP